MAAKPGAKQTAKEEAAKPDAGKAPAAVADAAQAAAGKKAAKDLAERLRDPAFQADIEQAVRELPPDKAAQLVAMLEASIKRRKLELWGYIAAAAIVVFGMVGAFLVLGLTPPGTFVGWVFLIPLGLAGLVMWRVGRRARASQRSTTSAPDRRAS
ncbi:MAG TPA: hypothetical protein VHE35_31770 [Kofleriaceae bacterium]|nr:hypothetical protein [Kofleriaceae bacterium]